MFEHITTEVITQPRTLASLQAEIAERRARYAAVDLQITEARACNDFSKLGWLMEQKHDLATYLMHLLSNLDRAKARASRVVSVIYALTQE